MVISNDLLPPTKFFINPKKLKINNDPIIDSKIVSLLVKKEIKLALDIFDSDAHQNKAAIVFIHGNSSSKKVFNEQIKYYSNHYRVIAFDLIGHGQSTKISEIDHLTSDEIVALSKAFYNPYSMIAEVKQLLEEINVKNAHIVGWSLGGHIAYGIAIANPTLVSSITTIGSPPIKFSTEGFKQGFHEWFVDVLVPEWVNRPKKYSTCDAKKISLNMGLKVEDPTFVDDLVSSDPQMRKYLFLDAEKYNAAKYNDTILDGEYFAKTTHLPLCLIVGGKDCGIKADYINSFNSKLMNQASRVIIIKDTMHAVFKTHANEIHHIIDEFLGGIRE